MVTPPPKSHLGGGNLFMVTSPKFPLGGLIFSGFWVFFRRSNVQILKIFCSRLRRSQFTICVWFESAPKMCSSRVGDFAMVWFSCLSCALGIMLEIHLWVFFRCSNAKIPKISSKYPKFSRSRLRRSRTRFHFGREARRKHVIFECAVLPHFGFHIPFFHYQRYFCRRPA